MTAIDVTTSQYLKQRKKHILKKEKVIQRHSVKGRKRDGKPRAQVSA